MLEYGSTRIKYDRRSSSRKSFFRGGPNDGRFDIVFNGQPINWLKDGENGTQNINGIELAVSNHRSTRLFAGLLHASSAHLKVTGSNNQNIYNGLFPEGNTQTFNGITISHLRGPE